MKIFAIIEYAHSESLALSSCDRPLDDTSLYLVSK